MTAYQPNIPTGTVNLDQDYINIRNNFTQLNNTYLIDHVAYNVPENNGYHKSVHMVPQIVDPVATPGVGQLYDKTINSINNDQTLFFLSGGDKRIQLTRNFLPVGAVGTKNRGFTFVAGGIMLQWGQVTLPGIPSSTGTVLFAGDSGIAFPTSGFTVFTSILYNSVPNAPSTVYYKNLTNLQFTWQFSGNSAATSFYWLAIGI